MLHHVLQLRPARLNEMFADRAFLQTVSFGELPNGLAVFPRTQTQHQFLPYCFCQRFTAMEHLVCRLLLEGKFSRPLQVGVSSRRAARKGLMRRVSAGRTWACAPFRDRARSGKR